MLYIIGSLILKIDLNKDGDAVCICNCSIWNVNAQNSFWVLYNFIFTRVELWIEFLPQYYSVLYYYIYGTYFSIIWFCILEIIVIN